MRTISETATAVPRQIRGLRPRSRMTCDHRRSPGTTFVIAAGAVDAPLRRMQHPAEIKFQGVEPSAAVEAFALAWTAKLDRMFDRIERCEVVIASPHHRRRHGRDYHVRIVVGVPGPDIVVAAPPAADGSHEDIYVAVRDAFRAARRQLQDRARLAAA
jgi:ribosome-associated translation inhibitor RaiA